MTKEKKPSKPYILAEIYVKKILRREWYPSDAKIVMAHAKSLLTDYEFDDLVGCLEAIADHIIDTSGVTLKCLSAIRWGEPPIIERWHQYKDNPPPVYQVGPYQEWLRRTGKEAPQATEISSQPKESVTYGIPIHITTN